MQRSCSTNTRHHNSVIKIHHNFGLGNLHHFFCQRLSGLSFSFYPCCFIYIFLLSSSSSCDFWQCRGGAEHTYSTKQNTKISFRHKICNLFSLPLSQIELVEEFCMMCHCCCCHYCFFSFLFFFSFILQFLGTRRRRRRCSTYCHSWS
jgi:hypothetical protein